MAISGEAPHVVVGCEDHSVIVAKDVALLGGTGGEKEKARGKNKQV